MLAKLKKTNSSRKKLTMVQTLAENINYLVANSGLTEAEASRQMGCPPQTLNRLSRAATPDPRISVLKTISDFFQVPISILLSEHLKNEAITKEYTPIPVLEWEELDALRYFSKLTSSKHRRWHPISIDVSAHTFALKTTRSMQPRYPYGSVFIIDPSVQPRDGDIVIVALPDKDTYIARELVIDVPHWWLKPVASEAKEIIFKSNKHTILGVVVEKHFFQPR